MYKFSSFFTHIPVIFLFSHKYNPHIFQLYSFSSLKIPPSFCEQLKQNYQYILCEPLKENRRMLTCGPDPTPMAFLEAAGIGTEEGSGEVWPSAYNRMTRY
jgi:hypothetical protein